LLTTHRQPAFQHLFIFFHVLDSPTETRCQFIDTSTPFGSPKRESAAKINAKVVGELGFGS
jgi:hypothetical protein